MRFWEASFLYFTPVQKQFQLLLVSLRWTGGKYFQLKIFHNLFLSNYVRNVVLCWVYRVTLGIKDFILRSRYSLTRYKCYQGIWFSSRFSDNQVTASQNSSKRLWATLAIFFPQKKEKYLSQPYDQSWSKVENFLSHFRLSSF